MNGVTMRILTPDSTDSKFSYSVHEFRSGEYTTRPPRPLEAENWDVLPRPHYADYR